MFDGLIEDHKINYIPEIPSSMSFDSFADDTLNRINVELNIWKEMIAKVE